MHADCGHGMIMATSMAQVHMQVLALVMSKAVRTYELGHKYAYSVRMNDCTRTSV